MPFLACAKGLTYKAGHGADDASNLFLRIVLAEQPVVDLGADRVAPQAEQRNVSMVDGVVLHNP